MNESQSKRGKRHIKICSNPDHVGENPIPISRFNKKGKTKTGVQRYQSWCRECNKKYLKTHYENNKKYYADKRDAWRADSPEKQEGVETSEIS